MAGLGVSIACGIVKEFVKFHVSSIIILTNLSSILIGVLCFNRHSNPLSSSGLSLPLWLMLLLVSLLSGKRLVYLYHGAESCWLLVLPRFLVSLGLARCLREDESSSNFVDSLRIATEQDRICCDGWPRREDHSWYVDRCFTTIAPSAQCLN